jgi:hypothetical protein
MAVAAACLVGATVVGCGADRERSVPGRLADADAVGGPRASIVLDPAGPGSASPTTQPAAVFEFVDYLVVRPGGASDHLKVFADGRATYSDGTRTVEFRLASSAVADLRAALERADFAVLDAAYGPPGPDLVQHRVLFGGDSVRFSAGSAPPPLLPAVDLLEREVQRGRQQG